MHNPLHPGEIVREALFNNTVLHTVDEAAKQLKVQRSTLSRLLNGHSGISAEMACRLALLLNTSAELWLNIQRDYALWMAKNKLKNIDIVQLAAA